MAAASSNLPAPFRIENGTIRLDFKLTPKAKQNTVIGLALDATGQTYLKAAVTAAPEHGKANAALIKLLAKEWGIAKSQITISRGLTSPRKTVEIADEVDKVRPRLNAWLENLAK